MALDIFGGPGEIFEHFVESCLDETAVILVRKNIDAIHDDRAQHQPAQSFRIQTFDNTGIECGIVALFSVFGIRVGLQNVREFTTRPVSPICSPVAGP